MFAILCRRGLRVPPKTSIFVAQQFRAPQYAAVLARSCASYVCENASEKKSFTVSYLINSCGLSSTDAVSASNKLCIESPEKPDAVLKLLKEYGFADAHIYSIISRLPNVLLTRSPNKTLLPKLQFFSSIGVPVPLLVKRISAQPSVLNCSLKDSIIPSYNYLKTLLGSDERVAHVFRRAPRAFGCCWSQGINPNISMLRERGVPESSIVTLVMHQPSLLVTSKEKLAVVVDRAVEMGFDILESGFVDAIQVFCSMSESTLKQKMEVYTRCGWTESDINAAVLRYPLCLTLSEKKITETTDILVNELGCKPVDIAKSPMLLSYSLKKRIKPRCLVARVLNEKGLLKKTTSSMTTLLVLSEEKFLNRYIVKYEKVVPELLDIYRGKSAPAPEVDLSCDK
ncbi:hypothetical protein PHJA_002476500 [Phtheirospermum japonicum]|uniref:Mitochondrial transcription termination factor n=1 Tax=Phtheirospermum japonicum TaxID=374723 RepID=A0A830CVV1_9LAMI|nr:hypothetical protein PHJA_002476500 [Phtheirospermum japonicum]